ncbi:MAG: ceramidase [Planctomycetaceae bacterium]|nr:ceramidase [Planctomycetaceae bacterium]
MSEVYISTTFLFAFRQIAGETPAILWSVDRFFCPQITQIRRIIFRDKWDMSDNFF